MRHFANGSGAISRSRRIPVLFTLGLLLALAFAGNALGAVTPVLLGNADSFAVLAGSTITNTGSTTVLGDIGLSPGSSETGFGTLTQTGTNHVADGVALGAQTDLTTAYNTAAGETPATASIVADLGGLTLPPGIYNTSSGIGITGTLTLDGTGNPNGMYVFQAGSTLITASASTVKLINVNPCNVFWQVGSSATLGTGSTLVGTVLALTSITVTTGVTVDGRVLARNGAVTLDGDTISSTCKNGSQPPADTTPPICRLIATNAGPPKQILVEVQDSGSGLGSIQVTTSTNATTTVPSFAPGTTSPVVVTATKLIQTAGSIVALKVTDAAGNSRTCDPLWPGTKAAKPTSRVKPHRVGRSAAGWGRRPT